MDFFKRNVILLSKFSIVILYMIIPAHTVNIQLCLEELRIDNLDTTTLFDVQSTDATEIITPYGIAYYNLFADYSVQMKPKIFCFWIINPKIDSRKIPRDDTINIEDVAVLEYYNLPKIWENIISKLITYTYNHTKRSHNAHYQLCLADLDNNDFNINSQMNSSTYTKDQFPKDIDEITTPHGIAYHTLLYVYKAKVNPKIFCKWVIDKYNVRVTEIYTHYNLHVVQCEMSKLWRNIIRDLTTIKHIGIGKNLHYNLCLNELRRDYFTSTEINPHSYSLLNPLSVHESDIINNIEHAKNTKDYFVTPFGKAYRDVLHVHERKMSKQSFCLWINSTHDYDPTWSIVKSEVIYNICLRQLKFDLFYVATLDIASQSIRNQELENWDGQEYTNRQFHEGNEDQPKTWHGKEFAKCLQHAENSQLPYPTSEEFCESFRAEYMNHISNP